LGGDPFLDLIRGDPRFKALVERLHFPRRTRLAVDHAAFQGSATRRGAGMKTTRRLIFLAAAGLAGAGRAMAMGLAPAATPPAAPPLSLSELLAAGRSTLAAQNKEH